MAENKEGQEKTEQASGKKITEARDKGQVSKSVDVTTSAALLFGTLLVFSSGAYMFGSIQELMKRMFGHLNEYPLTQDSVQTYFIGFSIYMGKLLLPTMSGIAAIIIIAEISQVGVHFATKKFTQGLNLINMFNPISGIKKTMLSGRSLFELLKSFLKLFLIGMIVWNVLSKYTDQVVLILQKPISDIGEFIAKVSLDLILKVGAVYIIIAAGDYFYQKYRFKEDMKMTKQEVKDEAKQGEGDQTVKQKIKSIMRGRLRKIMLANASKADVVITNPTHFAVAIEYKQFKHNAPVVVAKGVDFLAFKIREIAEANNIPIIEQPPLARAIYYSVDIEQEIPENLFKAVAQVLAFVFNLRKRRVNG